MKNIATLIIIKTLAGIGISVSSIWATVEFILYLVKDKSFNWWSVYSILICTLMVIVCVGIAYLKIYNNTKIPQRQFKEYRKSKFDKRLEEALNRGKQ